MAIQPDTYCALLNNCIQFLIEDMLGYNIKFFNQVPHDICYVVKFVSNNIYLRGKNKIVIISSALWLTYTKTVQKVLFYCLSSCKIRHKLFPRLSEDIYCKNTTSITTVCKRKAVIKMKLKLHFFAIHVQFHRNLV